jgi:hypothetical protein
LSGAELWVSHGGWVMRHFPLNEVVAQERDDAIRERDDVRALVRSARHMLHRCVQKLDVEYGRQQPDAAEGESWAEAEAARDMLDEIDAQPWAREG